MGMNLEELEKEREDIPTRRSRNFRALWDQAAQRATPIEVTAEVLSEKKFGEKDYIPNPERLALPPGRPPSEPVDPRVTVIGPTRRTWQRPVECNAISGYWEMCERGTVGCTNHRRLAQCRFFRCYINHHDGLCKCSQPVIVNQQMLDNAESAAMHVLGALKPDAKSSKLQREDLDYLAIHASRIMAHWARKALGHKPEDEK